MTLHICVLGIDGSGKSTITAALPNILAAELNLRVAMQVPDAAELKAFFEYLLEGKPLTKKIQAKLPHLEKARMVQRLAARFGLRAGWLPDVVIFLDLSPAIAMTRITSRGQKIDRHENEDDLAQARHMYLKILDAFGMYRSPEVAHCLAVDNMTPGETLRAVLELLKPHILAHQRQEMAEKVPLGTPTVELTQSAVWRKLLNYRYFVRYLMANWFRGAWREPTFMFSRLGRLLLREGYSAGVMRAIYDQDEKRYCLLDRIFLGYPLHRAVYDRLHILTRRIEADLEKRLQGGRDVNIFTAPSGFAYDLFQPLNAIANRMPRAMRHVRLVAADLDPHGYLENDLATQAEHLGLRFQFLRGDITDDTMRAKFEEAAPYDMVLFVGLSGWLPKLEVVRHLKWVYENITDDGVLVSDCFTPQFYALSGRYVGYKASYYTPSLYKAVMDYCGFDGAGARVESGRDEINHVMLFQPKQPDGLNRTIAEATEFLTGVKG